ncbi:MAG: hypothetical protein NVS9B14_18410 [Candidatus Acidiferrum sp.]
MELRKLFRLLAIVGALVFTVHQASIARQDYREWQAAMKIERSAAGLYRTNLEIDCTEILVAWAFAGGLIFVLRSKAQHQP